MKRRQFFNRSSLALGAGILSPTIIKTALAGQLQSDLTNADDDLTILFQGDSITDAHRSEAHYYPNQSRGMGNGYVYQIAAHLLGKYPDKNYQIYNRGISGHKVPQLDARWEDDCLQLQPDVLSLMIGVNDFWHTKTHNYQGDANSYESQLRDLLQRTKDQLPNIKMVIAEPFFVPGGTALQESWFADFAPYRKAAAKVAKEFSAVWLPYHELFAKALDTAPVSYWCPDGVHPSMAGAYLMANAWLEGFSKI